MLQCVNRNLSKRFLSVLVDDWLDYSRSSQLRRRLVGGFYALMKILQLGALVVNKPLNYLAADIREAPERKVTKNAGTYTAYSIFEMDSATCFCT